MTRPLSGVLTRPWNDPEATSGIGLMADSDGPSVVANDSELPGGSPYESEELQALYHWNRTTDEPSNGWYLGVKAIVDRVLAALLLVPGLPLIALLAGIVRLSSPGPGLFRQTRVGRHGTLFTMYKLRTMRSDAEAAIGAVWSRAGDTRITMVGRILRKLHLDELPQLFNVLKGEMSLVGPRPERPEFVEVLAYEVDGYVDRLSVVPGITGLAQINLPPDTDYASVCRKQRLDIEYIECLGWSLDVRIVSCTFLRMLGIRSHRLLELLGVDRWALAKSVRVSPVTASRALPATPTTVARQAYISATTTPENRAASVLAVRRPRTAEYVPASQGSQRFRAGVFSLLVLEPIAETRHAVLPLHGSGHCLEMHVAILLAPA